MAYSIRCADAGVDCPGSFTTARAGRGARQDLSLGSAPQPAEDGAAIRRPESARRSWHKPYVVLRLFCDRQVKRPDTGIRSDDGLNGVVVLASLQVRADAFVER